jgi:hypothetical protein
VPLTAGNPPAVEHIAFSNVFSAAGRVRGSAAHGSLGAFRAGPRAARTRRPDAGALRPRHADTVHEFTIPTC